MIKLKDWKSLASRQPTQPITLLQLEPFEEEQSTKRSCSSSAFTNGLAIVVATFLSGDVLLLDIFQVDCFVVRSKMKLPFYPNYYRRTEM